MSGDGGVSLILLCSTDIGNRVKVFQNAIAPEFMLATTIESQAGAREPGRKLRLLYVSNSIDSSISLVR